MNIDFQLAESVLTSQPFSRLIGARLTTFETGTATLEIPIRDELLQHDGHLHGGVLSYAADNAITFAAGSALGPAVLTSGLSVSYLRPAMGRALLARATVVHAGRRQAVCRCDLVVVDGDEPDTLCAVAQGTVLTRQPGPPLASRERPGLR
ncbi:PaaI family thioesterase [Streptomyces sp. GC420]|uniref:PaaI family thioesterase n=1 Tax=Streptomyces sp. GC420 TaxID=2697568 RepID=UPI001414F003|nr:PaaI family thioesterase [Streptomyces sp. GC420]NBM16169.1 hotdog fold thioesterase [Streptomyces sp. GC420]